MKNELNEAFERHKKEEQEKQEVQSLPRMDATRLKFEKGRMVFERDIDSDPGTGPYECEHC